MVTTLTLHTRHFVVLSVAQPLLDFVSTSLSLVKVNVRAEVGNEQVFSLFVEVVCGNNIIQNLIVSGLPVSPREFKALMTEPQSLRELHFWFANQRWTDDDRRMVTEGIKRNENRLQHLSLGVFTDGIEEDTLQEHVLRNLHHVRSLRVLNLHFQDNLGEISELRGVLAMFDALEYYMQRVDWLRQVGFFHLLLNESLMTKLLSGLGRTATGAQLITVSELSFTHCGFTNGTAACKSALRKLFLSLDVTLQPEDLDDASLWERLAEPLLEQYDATQSGMVRTVGSQIEDLHITSVRRSFLQYIGINADRFRVKHLSLCLFVPNIISACLPKMATVTSLTLTHTQQSSCSAIVEGLKHNGSIMVVTTGCTSFGQFGQHDWHGSKYVNKFDKKQQRLMHAYAQRNEFWSKYLGLTSTTDAIQGTPSAALSDGIQGTANATTTDGIQGTANSVPPDGIQGPADSAPPDGTQGTADSAPTNCIQGTADATTTNAIQETADTTTTDGIQETADSAPTHGIQGTDVSHDRDLGRAGPSIFQTAIAGSVSHLSHGLVKAGEHFGPEG